MGPGGHQWYESTIVHIGWNNIVSMAGLQAEFHIGQHMHDNVYRFTILPDVIPSLLVALIGIPVVWHIIRKKTVQQTTFQE